MIQQLCKQMQMSFFRCHQAVSCKFHVHFNLRANYFVIAFEKWHANSYCCYDDDDDDEGALTWHKS